MSKKKLSEIGKILRCPIAHSENPKIPMMRVIYHGDIDRLSGIVNFWNASWERLEYSPSWDRYELRPGDTVLVFNGMKERVGICGFVADSGTRALTATSLCVIRPDNVDPVWLFHRLRTMRKSLLSLYQAKRSIGYISMGDLGELEIEMPAEGDVRSVNEIWRKVVDQWRENRKLIDEIDSIFVGRSGVVE